MLLLRLLLIGRLNQEKMNNFVKYWVNLIVLIAITCLFANSADGTTYPPAGEGVIDY